MPLSLSLFLRKTCILRKTRLGFIIYLSYQVFFTETFYIIFPLSILLIHRLHFFIPISIKIKNEMLLIRSKLILTRVMLSNGEVISVSPVNTY